jgi:predicted nucleotidyltransferase
MITELISRSRVRAEVLATLFSAPESRYYQRQLERLLRHPVSAIRRELLRLEREGLVRKIREANLVYFQSNREHPLFEEVRSIVEKTVGVPSEIRRRLVDLKGVRIALIFGSYSRALAKEPDAQWTGQSDIDVLIIGGVDLGDVASCLRPVEERFQRSINPTLYTANEIRIRLKKRDDFVADVLAHAVIPLIGLGASEILKTQRITAEALREGLNGSESHRRPRRR